ncbi:hypothetical protein DFH06DRAFT_1326743 [Mycena polygramma]|nr:hypothetical protein DFH06DRAFT_1326743 [Mycena polygramma]
MARRCEPPFYLDPGAGDKPVLGRKLYVVCGRNVKHPGTCTLWCVYTTAGVRCNSDQCKETVCVPGLVQQEDQLREAQAGGALHELRSGLRTHQFKCKHTSGQGMYMKTRSLLDRIEARICSAADAYGALQTALFALHSPGALEGKVSRAEEGGPEGDKRTANANKFGEPVKLTVLFDLETDVMANGTSHKDICVQWAKAHTRIDRWQEELILLEEEMHCILEFCSWKARWWEARVQLAAWEQKWESLWRWKWAAVCVWAGLALFDHIVPVTEGVLVPLEVDLEDENEEEAPEESRRF